VASHWARCRRGVSSNWKIAGQQPLHCFFILKDHDQIHSFHTDLYPQFPPEMVMNAGALQPFGVRQVATPLPLWRRRQSRL